MFQIAMGGSIDSEAYCLEDEYGQTLLQRIARCIAEILARGETNDTHVETIASRCSASADPYKISWNFGTNTTILILFLQFLVWEWKKITI
ncbi:hypothetical protein BDV06DRAFT_191546, partial [Aspergillus oleicola]